MPPLSWWVTPLLFPACDWLECYRVCLGTSPSLSLCLYQKPLLSYMPIRDGSLHTCVCAGRDTLSFCFTPIAFQGQTACTHHFLHLPRFTFKAHKKNFWLDVIDDVNIFGLYNDNIPNLKLLQYYYVVELCFMPDPQFYVTCRHKRKLSSDFLGAFQFVNIYIAKIFPANHQTCSASINNASV